MIPEFINPDTGNRYGDNIPVVAETIRGIETYVITTSKVKELARDHFGTKKFLFYNSDYNILLFK